MFVAHTLLWLKFRTQRQVRNAGWHYSLYSSSVLLSSILSFPRILGVSERQVRLRTAKFKDKKNINVVNMPGVHSKNADVDPGSPPVKPVKLGASYKTFSEVEAAMAEYEVKFNVPYVTNGSKLVGTYNKQKGTDLPNNLKYSRIKYACKHHGQGRPSSKGIRPNQNTFKQGCPAIVIFNVNLETRELEVSTEVTNHVHLHETDPSDFPNYPENRRGNIKKDVLEEVEKLLDLNVETTRLLEYLELFKNKSLTAQDVANIKAKLKKTRRQGRSESEEFFDELESLLQKDPGSKVIFGADPIAEDSEEEDNEEADDPNDAKEKRTKAQLNYVYFHTAEMGETFEKFSDVLVADSTYCTNKYDMPLMAFLCLDENGNGRVAGYCLMRDESKANVKNAVSAFCAAHPTAQSKVRTVLVDKDYNEREAIRELFPDAVIHICLFHTLQIFQRQSKTEPDKENVRIVLEGIAYSESKEAYIELYDKLKSVASALFIKYFDENWNNCHECWALFHRDMSVNCGQTTTNIAESHNQKIKAILKKKRASMVELLRNLLLLHSSKTSRVAMNAFNSKVKIRYITNSDDPVVQKITNLTTPFVGDLLKTQYNWAMEKASMPDALPANFDYSSCTCRFYKSFQLPCSHIFLGRLRGDVEIFDVENIPDRWQKNAPSAEQHNEDSVAVYVPNRLKKKTKPLMENERFNLVVEKTERLTQMVKTCGGNQFSRRLTALQKIEDIWSRGKEIIVLEEGIGEFLCENIVLVDDDHQTLNSNETEQVCPSGEVNNNSEKRDENPSRKVITKSREDAKRRGDLTCAETGAKSLKVTSAAQYKFLDPNLRSTLTLPVGHVPKGRPKGKQRQTVIGRKRQDKPKQLVQASSSQSQTSETISQTCYCAEEPPAVRRKCTNGGPNNGRYFFACHKSHKEGNCNFFVWDTPICACGDQCIMRKTRTGQTYYGCWKHQCQVVFWLDEEVAEKDILLEEAEHVEKEVEYNEESETYNGSENGNEDDDDDDGDQEEENNINDQNMPDNDNMPIKTEPDTFIEQYSSDDDDICCIYDSNKHAVGKNLSIVPPSATSATFPQPAPSKVEKCKTVRNPSPTTALIAERENVTVRKHRAPKVPQSTDRPKAIHDIPHCYCNLKAVMNKSYDQDGGVFFTCPEKDSTKSCQYYKWDGSMSMFLEAETSANPSENSCFLCKQQGLPTEDSAHKCAICNKPVHAFGCSVEIPGGEEGYGGSDRQCLSCAKGDSHSTSHHTSITIGKNESTKQLVDYDSSASEDTENSVPSVKATFDVTPRKRNSSSLLLSTTPFKRKFSDNISESCHDSPTKRPMIKSPQKYYTPKCLCALIAKRSSSYKNAGREFFECPRGKSIGCTYFRWADTLYNIAPRCNIDSSLVNASSSLDKDNLLNDSDEVFSDPSLNLIPSLFDAPNAQAPLEDEILGDINKTEPEKIGGRPVRSRLLPKRLRKSYLIDETP